MNKFFKGILLLTAIAISTNISAGSGNEWFKKHPVIKSALVFAATVTPTIAVPAALTLYDYMNEAYRVEFHPEAYVLSELARITKSVLTNTRILTAEEIFMQKVAKNIAIGVATGFSSFLFANNYPTEYLVTVGLGGLAVVAAGSCIAAKVLVTQ